MNWLRRHPVVVNLVLAFAVALFAGLWANFWTSATQQNPMSDRKHLLLIVAVVLLLAQCRYNLTGSGIERKVVGELLDLGIRFFVAHASKDVAFQDIRAIVHLCERSRPGANLKPQRCLVPRYWKSPVQPRDFGAIPVDAESFKSWYVNVAAFHAQRVVCREPAVAERPSADDHYVSTPSLFSAKSVMSAPIWSRLHPPTVIGTVTFDSVRSVGELDWCDDGMVNEAAKDMLTALADLIGKILSDDEAA